MRLVDFHPDHLAMLNQREQDVIGDRGMWEEMAVPAVAVTAVHDEEVVAVMAIVCPYEGVGYAWARVSDAARGRGVALTRAAREAILMARANLPLRQVRAAVMESRPEYMRWLRLLGFEPEGIKWGAAPDGGNLVEYVRWMTSSAAAATAGVDRASRRPITTRCGATTRNGQPTWRPDARPH